MQSSVCHRISYPHMRVKRVQLATKTKTKGCVGNLAENHHGHNQKRCFRKDRVLCGLSATDTMGRHNAPLRPHRKTGKRLFAPCRLVGEHATNLSDKCSNHHTTQKQTTEQSSQNSHEVCQARETRGISQQMVLNGKACIWCCALGQATIIVMPQALLNGKDDIRTKARAKCPHPL